MGPEERKLSEVGSADPDEVRRASSTWSRLSQDLDEVAAVLRGKVDREIEGAWHGPAADLAREAFGAMAAAVQRRAQSMDLVSRQLDAAATSLATAKSKLSNLGPAVLPAPDPTDVDLGDPSQEITYAKLYSRHATAAAQREENARRAYQELESSLADSESAMGEDMAHDFRSQGGSTSAYSGAGAAGPSGGAGGYAAASASPSVGPAGGGPRSPILVPGSGPSDYQPGGTAGGSWAPGSTPSGDDDGGLTADAGPGADATPWTPAAGGTGGGETVPYSSGGGGLGLGAGAGTVAGVGGVLGAALGLGKSARGGGSALVGGSAPSARGAGGRVIGGVAAAGGAGTSSRRPSGGARSGAGAAGRVRPKGSVGSAGGRSPAGAGGTSGARGVPPTVAARGAREKEDAEAFEALAVEDDWFGEDEAAPDVLR